jgi:hypothetical protein
MANQVTVTGKVGPGLTATTVLITDVVEFKVENLKKVLTVTQADGRVRAFDIAADTTFTVTVSSGTYVVAVSA